MSAMVLLDTVFPAAMIGWLLSQVLGAVTAKWLTPSGIAPRIRQQRILMVAFSAVFLPLVMMAAILAANLFPSSEWMASHCGTHSHDHIHACLNSAEQGALPAWQGAVALLALVMVMVSLFRTLVTERRLQRRLQALITLSKGQGRFRRLHDTRAVALAVGGNEPAVLLSSGLLNSLNPHQRRIVLAHESAHLRHGDPRRNRLVVLLLALFVPPLAKRLRTAWENALEEAADDAVTQRFNRFDVAETLLRVLSLQQLHMKGAQSVNSGDTQARIQRLITPHQVDPVSGRWFEWTCLLVLPAMLVAVLVQHHAIETLLSWLGA
ncbi:MAG: beta-lactamase regulating signal transducer with metallopeptidase domain [Alcanivorax sp.]|jgi:beta-lactamase regulating signal transducer with metallopeptidase domain|uniref:M56 family metallopeptidase n=1 Tax=Alcanivorax sp. TaxID=1872427 RepID=UPI0039E3B52B